MSYIRCLSNPERLYIWNEGKFVAIDFDFGANDTNRFRIPSRTFHHLLKKWNAGGKCNVKCKYASLIQNEKTYKWCLTYKQNRVDMYEVTLFYVSHTAHKHYINK